MVSFNVRVTNQHRNSDSDNRYEHASRHLRHKAEALASRRWRILNRQIDTGPYIDSSLKHGGGIL